MVAGSSQTHRLHHWLVILDLGGGRGVVAGETGMGRQTISATVTPDELKCHTHTTVQGFDRQLVVEI
jgi:hypothetical protein